MQEFCFVLSAIAAGFSVVAMLYAARSAALLRALRVASADFPQPRMQSIERSVTSLTERLGEAEEALKLVANRVKMMRVRSAATHTDSSPGEPDPKSDPERWRTWMNAKLSRQRFGL
jgi:hypothetical protein